MGDEPPILDYRQPPAAREGVPVVVRVVCALLATPVTLVGAALVGAGMRDATRRGQLFNLVPGLLFAGLAYLLWRPVGLRLWRRGKDKEGQ